MANNILNTKILLCTDTTSNWKQSSKVLLKGEVGIEFPESGEPKVKIGNGADIWTALPYITLNTTEINQLIAALNASKHSHSNKSILDATTASFTTALKNKLDGITASADSVSFTSSQTGGVKIGTITINNTATDLYAPLNTDTTATVTQNLTTASADYPVLLAPSDQTATANNVSYFNTRLKFNPGTNTLTATTFSGSLSGNAASATQIYSTLYNSEGSTGLYYIPFHDNASSGNKSLRNNNGLRYYSQNGTTSAVGISIISVGNETASGTAGNKRGRLRIYNASSGWTDFYTSESTNNYQITFPAATGTVALTSNLSSYLPLTGGTLTSSSFYVLSLKRSDTNGSALSYQNSSGALGGSGFLSDKTFVVSSGTNTNGDIFKATTTNATFPGTVTATAFSGNATSASQIYSTLTNPTAEATYCIPFHINASSTNKALCNNNGLQYINLEGTSAVAGYSILKLGNGIASGTAANKQGRIRIYNSSSGHTDITTATSTSSYSITFPAASGTIALTSSSVISVVTGTFSAGSTIATVPYSSGKSKAMIDVWYTVTDTSGKQSSVYGNALVTGISNNMTAIGSTLVVTGSGMSVHYEVSTTGVISFKGNGVGNYRVIWFN